MTGTTVRHLGEDLPRLTSLRAFAALAVFFFFHIARNTSWGPGGITFMHGYVGVAFFYVLSGFVLTWSTRPETTTGTFYVRRFARVYPSHFVMFLVALVLPILAFPVSWQAAGANVLLIQAWFPQWPIAFGMDAVSWSLSCEFFFYACTPFLLRWGHRRSDRTLVVALLGWFAVTTLGAVALTLNGLDIYAFTNPLIRSGEFGLGVLAGLLALRGRLPRVPMWVAVAVVGAVWYLTVARQLPQSLTGAAFALPFLLLVVAGATNDLARRPGPLRSRALVYAGQVSFGFYLVHELVIINGEPYWSGWAQSKTTAVLLLLGVLTLAFLLATALHEWVERPCQRLIRSRWEPSKRAGVTP